MGVFRERAGRSSPAVFVSAIVICLYTLSGSLTAVPGVKNTTASFRFSRPRKDGDKTEEKRKESPAFRMALDSPAANRREKGVVFDKGGGVVSDVIVLDHNSRLCMKNIESGQSCTFVHPTPN